jgi:hypothetical protein
VRKPGGAMPPVLPSELPARRPARRFVSESIGADG